MELDPSTEARARVFAALGDPLRLAIVEALALSDLAPSDIEARFEVGSNLLTHHLDILERAGLIRRTRSSGDARRRYVSLRADAIPGGIPSPIAPIEAQRVLFVCTGNSARSPLAAALWNRAVREVPATSAGTRPAASAHPLAVEAGAREGLRITHVPQLLDEIQRPGDLVVTVCDQAHEGDAAAAGILHWSIPDPAADGHLEAFTDTTEQLRTRIEALARCTRAPRRGHRP